jgi:thioredoxin reductase (NADPH)
VMLDAKGFVVTGEAGRHELETSRHGVSAVGDVRSGSVKRVGAAVGEGAQVVTALHSYLAVAAVRFGPIKAMSELPKGTLAGELI